MSPSDSLETKKMVSMPKNTISSTATTTSSSSSTSSAKSTKRERKKRASRTKTSAPPLSEDTLLSTGSVTETPPDESILGYMSHHQTESSAASPASTTTSIPKEVMNFPSKSTTSLSRDFNKRVFKETKLLDGLLDSFGGGSSKMSLMDAALDTPLMMQDESSSHADSVASDSLPSYSTPPISPIPGDKCLGNSTDDEDDEEDFHDSMEETAMAATTPDALTEKTNAKKDERDGLTKDQFEFPPRDGEMRLEDLASSPQQSSQPSEPSLTGGPASLDHPMSAIPSVEASPLDEDGDTAHCDTLSELESELDNMPTAYGGVSNSEPSDTVTNFDQGDSNDLEDATATANSLADQVLGHPLSNGGCSGDVSATVNVLADQVLGNPVSTGSCSGDGGETVSLNDIPLNEQSQFFYNSNPVWNQQQNSSGDMAMRQMLSQQISSRHQNAGVSNHEQHQIQSYVSDPFHSTAGSSDVAFSIGPNAEPGHTFNSLEEGFAPCPPSAQEATPHSVPMSGGGGNLTSPPPTPLSNCSGGPQSVHSVQNSANEPASMNNSSHPGSNIGANAVGGGVDNNPLSVHSMQSGHSPHGSVSHVSFGHPSPAGGGVVGGVGGRLTPGVMMNPGSHHASTPTEQQQINPNPRSSSSLSSPHPSPHMPLSNNPTLSQMSPRSYPPQVSPHQMPPSSTTPHNESQHSRPSSEPNPPHPPMMPQSHSQHQQQHHQQQQQMLQQIQSLGGSGLQHLPTPLPHKTNPYHQQPPQTPTPPQGHHQQQPLQQQLPLRSGNQNIYPQQQMGMHCNQNSMPSRYPSGATPPAPNPLPHKTNPYNQPQPNACRTPPSMAAQGAAHYLGLPPTSDGSYQHSYQHQVLQMQQFMQQQNQYLNLQQQFQQQQHRHPQQTPPLSQSASKISTPPPAVREPPQTVSAKPKTKSKKKSPKDPKTTQPSQNMQQQQQLKVMGAKNATEAMTNQNAPQPHALGRLQQMTNGILKDSATDTGKGCCEDAIASSHHQQQPQQHQHTFPHSQYSQTQLTPTPETPQYHHPSFPPQQHASSAGYPPSSSSSSSPSSTHGYPPHPSHPHQVPYGFATLHGAGMGLLIVRLQYQSQ